jgi:hypothetical protein
MKNRVISLAVVMAIVCLLGGCGYRILPRPVANSSGSEKFRLYAPQWENRTNELGLESSLNDALVNWFTESGHFAISQQRENADYVLNGEVISTEHPGSSYGAFDQATGLKAVIKVSYSLSDAHSGAVIFKEPLYVGETTYLVGADAVQTLALRKQALASMADEIGEEVYIRLLTTLTGPETPQPAALPAPASKPPE